MDISGSDLFWIAMLVWFGVVLTGVVMGIRERLVMFRNYSELGLVFGSAFLGVVGFWIVAFGINEWHSRPMQAFGAAVLLTAATLIVVVGRQTWADNSPAHFLIAFVAKMALSLLFLSFLMEVVSPGGKNRARRSGNRAIALVVSGLLGHLINKLVRQKTGFMASRFTRFN